LAIKTKDTQDANRPASTTEFYQRFRWPCWRGAFVSSGQRLEDVS
jgi:hypothetical protein